MNTNNLIILVGHNRQDADSVIEEALRRPVLAVRLGDAATVENWLTEHSRRLYGTEVDERTIFADAALLARGERAVDEIGYGPCERVIVGDGVYFPEGALSVDGADPGCLARAWRNDWALALSYYLEDAVICHAIAATAPWAEPLGGYLWPEEAIADFVRDAPADELHDCQAEVERIIRLAPELFPAPGWSSQVHEDLLRLQSLLAP